MILFYTLLFIAQSFAEPVRGDSIPQQSILADGGKKGNGNASSGSNPSQNTPRSASPNTLNQNATSTNPPPKQEPVCEHLINGMVSQRCKSSCD